MLKMRFLIGLLTIAACLMTEVKSKNAILGAGVIPYTFKKNCGSSKKTRAYILLGEEFCYQDQSYRLSSFGGSFDELFDITLEDVASREAFEETMGIFLKPTKKDPKPELNRAEGMSYFKKRFNENFTVINKTKRDNQWMEKGTYFVKVPYIKASKFERVRKRLEKRKIAERCFLEKKSFVWIRVNRVLKLVNKVSDSKLVQSAQSFTVKKSKDKCLELSSAFVRGLCNDECRTILRSIQLSAQQDA